MSLRVAVTGAAGQLGTDVVSAFRAAGHDVVALTHAELDLADSAQVQEAIERTAPSLIINAAAYADVEGCERDPDRAFAVNATGVARLARAAASVGARLVQVSTDYVFDGARGTPYVEDDAVAPLNAYGNSKASGEFFARALAPGAVVVRVSALYGHSPCRSKAGLNFIDRMLQLAAERGEVRVVADEVVTPTYTVDVAAQLVALAATDVAGVVHATAGGECSWYEFARAIFEEAGVPVRLEPARAADFGGMVRRPPCSVLANERLQALGIDLMPHWRDGLRAYFAGRR